MSGKGKKLSGWERKKAEKERREKINAVLKNVPKLDLYFQPIRDSAPECEIHQEPSTSGRLSDADNSKCSDIDGVSISPSPQECSLTRHTELSKTEVSEKTAELAFKSEDPAEWIVNESLIDHLVKNPLVQNISNMNFEKSKRNYDVRSRYASKSVFFKKLHNGEFIRRQWLLYSGLTGHVFCLYCKLFNRNSTSSFVTGFNDWKNACRISEHENSTEHYDHMKAYLMRSNTLGKIDTEIHKQFLAERNYWVNVLRRIVAVVKFLTSRGLAFRGTTEMFGTINNGNFLGALELIAEFDPFLKNHIETKGNQGRGHVSYLSSTICDEFIKLMANSLRKKISLEVQNAKYFSVIVDSTPDISHSDQLCIVLRYVREDGSPVERFITFLSKVGHKAANMETAILNTLEYLSLNLQNCRGQSYDNASNMSGPYSGLQARIKAKNKLAKFVPCAAHSLNLVGTCAAECCSLVANFFLFIEEIYVFFSASTYRWEVMKNFLEANKTVNKAEQLVPKKLSVTRWSARNDACTALYNSYEAFKQALEHIVKEITQTPKTKAEGEGILQKMSNLETGIMLSFWKDILIHFHKTSQSLQKENMDILIAIQLYESLIEFVTSIRGDFDKYEEDGKRITKCFTYGMDTKRKRKRKLHAGENPDEDTIFDGKKDMEVNMYYVVIDNIISELKKRKNAYWEINEEFGFIMKLENIEDEVIKEKCRKIRDIYSKDLDNNFESECVQFKYFITTLELGDCLIKNTKLITWSKIIREKNLTCTFPNMDILLRIFLCLPVTNCTGERSFSCLKRVKNCQRSCLLDEKTADLSLLSIEAEEVRLFNFEDLIQTFSNMKCRKIKL